MLKKAKIYIVFTLIAASVFCTASCSAGQLQSIIDKYKQSKTKISLYAIDAATKTILYQVYPERQMIPASNMKLVSTAAALHYLGGDYTFKTQVGILGKDLIVVGGGDPLLGDPKNDSTPSQAANRIMDRIVTVLKDANIAEIDNIIVDTSFFDNNRVHPSWPRDQLNQWYACEVCGLNFYDNCVHITTTRVGGRAAISMEPANNYVHLVNQLKLVSKGSSAVGAYRNSVPNKLLIRGKLNQKAGFDVAIENPAGLFASVLRDHLQSQAIAVRGNLIQKYVKNEPGIRYLYTFETPIADVIKRANTDSLGLAAECLVKTISAENTRGRINGEWPHGLTLLSRYLQSLGIPEGQFTLDDGCGLSDKNRLSAKLLVSVLNDTLSGPNARVFAESLAVGGEEGTIARYFHQSPYEGNIHGKTGYIDGVRTFSGICKTGRGEIIFSILTENGNGYTRRCINEITKAIFDGTL